MKNILDIKHKRHSHYLPIGAVTKIRDRVRVLEAQGYVYNYWFSIHLESEGITHPQKAVSTLVNRMQKWHKSLNIPFRYLWVLEKSNGIGVHVHIAIHTDLEIITDLDSALTEWLPFQRDDYFETKNTNIKYESTYDLWGLIHYMCKGLDRRDEIPFYSDKQFVQGHEGYIRGRRYGMSQF